MATNFELVARLYIAYFDRAPDPLGLQHWVDDLNAGGSLLEAANNFAGSTEAKQTYPYLLAPSFLNAEDFIKQVYQNVLARDADADGLAYYSAKLAAGVSPGEVVLDILNNAVSNPNNDDALRLQNKVDVGLYWAQQAAANLDLTYADADGHLTPGANVSAHGVIDGVDNTTGSVTEGNTETDTFFATGQTFILSPNADLGLLPGQDFYGTEKNDTYIAGTVNSGIFSGNTLGTGDAFDGAGGTDLLQILDNGFLPLTPQIKNIEKVSLQALGPAPSTVVLTNAQGVEEIINDRSAANAIFNSIQNNVLISVVGTSVDTQANFANGIDLGGEVNIAVDGAGTGTGGNRANIYVSTDNAPTTLNIDASGEASFVRVEVDGTPGAGGAAVALETLNITGDADLNLRGGIGGIGEFDRVTTVNVDSTGDINLNFSNNNQNVTYNGANGSGDDVLDFSGNGNNTIDTGAGNDWVDVSGNGANTVNLGDGDDFVNFGTNATAADKADGGDGIDTIAINAQTLTGLTANSTFEGSIQNFEKVYATGNVGLNATATIDLANLDDINYVITDGTSGTINAVSEVQRFNVTVAGDVDGGEVLVGGVRIAIPNSASTADIANTIAGKAADIIAANPTIASVTANGSQVVVTYNSDAGNVPAISISSNNASNVTFDNFNTPNPGTTEVPEQQTLTIIGIGGFVGVTAQVTVTVSQSTGGTAPVFVDLVAGQTVAQAASAIASALAASGVPGIAGATATGNVVTISYTGGYNPAPATYAPFTTLTAGVVATPVPYVAPVAETQTVHIASGTDANGGEIVVAGVRITLDGNLTVDQVGAAIVAQFAAIQATNPDITAITYNAGTDVLTFNYAASAGDVPVVSIGNNNTGASFGGVNTNPQGFAGIPGGVTTLNNIQSGGTLELNGDNDGHTFINLATQTANDSFNIILNDGIGNSDGKIHLAGIETLNVTQLDTDAAGHRLGLDAGDTTTVTVSGTGGVNFIDAFAKLTSFDASGVTGTGAVGAVTVVTNAVANTSLTGGAGDDSLTGSNSAAHVDTINGGDGNDTIIGRAGADVLTGGAGNDLFVYQNVADSQGTTIDTITDFVSGQDKLDFSGVAGVNHANASYDGAANGYGAVLTALTADGNTHAVLDSSTSILYVDVNGDGILNNVDMAIELTGVTSLSNTTDFNW